MANANDGNPGGATQSSNAAPNNEPPWPDGNARIEEYAAVQDSAQHHDNLLWYVTSIIWTGNLVLLGSVLQTTDKVSNRFLVFLAGILGISLNIIVLVCASRFRSIRNQKYEFCKVLEDRLDLGCKQHTRVKHPSGEMWALYRVATALFLFVWLVVLVWSMCYLACDLLVCIP